MVNPLLIYICPSRSLWVFSSSRGGTNGPAFQVAPLRARRNDLGDLGEVSPSSQDGFLVEGYPPVN